MKNCTTVNNADLVINEATFKEAIRLQKVIFEEAKKLKLDIGDIDIEVFSSVKMLLNTFKDMFLNLMTSKEFEDVLFQCLKHCTYNDVQITPNLFEDIAEARCDYYEIIKECLEVNLSPFLKSLTSQLSSLFPTTKLDNQELEVQ